MIRAIWSSASGLQAQQRQIDVIANNVANVNTYSYKRATAGFRDLVYQSADSLGRFLPGELDLTTGIKVGAGVDLNSIRLDMRPGSLMQTDGVWDIAIAGEGFIRVALPQGGFAYTRDGALGLNAANGRLILSTGYQIEPPIVLPEDTTTIEVSPNGWVTAELRDGSTSEVGQIMLYHFGNPGGLASAGGNLFVPTAASGEALEGEPATGNFGRIRQGFREGSNVNIAMEMTNLIVAQRAYELNSRAVRNADEMLAVANNIKG